MTTCPNCGLPDQQDSCDHCGTVVRDDPSPVAPGERQPPAEASSGRPGSTASGAQAGQQSQPVSGQQGGREAGPEGGTPAQGHSLSADAGATTVTDRISRRKLLVGGAAGAAVAASGSWYFFLRGPDGAKAVAADTMSAISNDDWEQLRALHHEEAPDMVAMDNGDFDSYEEFLEQRGSLETLEEVEPSVKELIEYRHIPEFSEEAADELFFQVDPEDASIIEEAKQILVVADLDLSELPNSGETQEYLSGDTTKQVLNIVAVTDEGGWSLWRPPVFF